MIMQAEISNTRGEDSSCGDVTPITFLPSSFRSPPVGPQVYIYIIHLCLYDSSLSEVFRISKCIRRHLLMPSRQVQRLYWSRAVLFVVCSSLIYFVLSALMGLALHCLPRSKMKLEMRRQHISKLLEL